MTPLNYNQKDAAALLGMGVKSFRRHVRPHVRAVYVGNLTLYPRAELERWNERSTS